MKTPSKAAIVMVTLSLAATAMAQDLEKSVFGPVEETRAQADRADAGLLSPNTYSRGISNLELAQRKFSKGKNLNQVRKLLADADADLRAASENAELAKLTLGKGIKSREAAQKAEAGRLVPRDWRTAEETFNAAALALEKGNVKAAQKKHDQADEQFRTAELNAAKTFVLAEAWRLIAEADEKKTEKFAPHTLGQAKRIAARANSLIVKDRYSLDEPQALAERAAYEARHALYIATLVRQIDREDASIESLILNWEASLTDIGMAASVDPDFLNGPETTSSEIITVLEELPVLRSDLKDRDALVVDLEEEIRELDAALGGASADRSQLIRRLERQARVREQFRQVENMFTSGEAIVLRDGNNLIVRLVGLNFASSSARLSADAEPLLRKVQSAIDVFPQCALTIEGHTDAQGNADRNRALSENRAQEVKRYIIEVMRIPAFRIDASGYGDTRPIANNKSDEGRAKNRRIDLIIAPNPESL